MLVFSQFLRARQVRRRCSISPGYGGKALLEENMRLQPLQAGSRKFTPGQRAQVMFA